MKAKELIDNDFIGRPYSARVHYLHSGNSDPSRPTYWKILKILWWRFIYDLGSHIIDIIRFYWEISKNICQT